MTFYNIIMYMILLTHAGSKVIAQIASSIYIGTIIRTGLPARSVIKSQAGGI